MRGKTFRNPECYKEYLQEDELPHSSLSCSKLWKRWTTFPFLLCSCTDPLPQGIIISFIPTTLDVGVVCKLSKVCVPMQRVINPILRMKLGVNWDHFMGHNVKCVLHWDSNTLARSEPLRERKDKGEAIFVASICPPSSLRIKAPSGLLHHQQKFSYPLSTSPPYGRAGPSLNSLSLRKIFWRKDPQIGSFLWW